MKVSLCGACAPALALAGLLSGCDAPHAVTAASKSGAVDPRDALGVALAGPDRSAASRARDPSRHPRETLTFFGLRADMTVVELFPGGGWYTEILAPYLAPKGRLIVTGSKVVAERIEQEPAVFGKVTLNRVDFASGDPVLASDASADLVVTFRNVHNWMGGGFAEKVFAAAFRVLKHGGVFGVVEHRAKPGTDAKASAESGYVTEETVIDFAKKAGFEVEAKSEINANPNDTKDHKGGVWALPPSFANGDADQAKYAAVGESDRMTIRFKKP